MRTITNNEILFTCKDNVERPVDLTLHKQSYSDGTCFYSLQDRRGNWKVQHGSMDLNELIKQMEHEIKISESVKEEEFYKTNEDIRKVYDEIERWKMEIASKIKEIAC